MLQNLTNVPVALKYVCTVWSACTLYSLVLIIYDLWGTFSDRLSDFFFTSGFSGSQGKPLQTVEAYDWVGDTWSEIKACPTTHCSCAFTMQDDRLLVIGGLSMAGPSSSMEVLSFKPDKWPVCVLVCFYYILKFFILFFLLSILSCNASIIYFFYM